MWSPLLFVTAIAVVMVTRARRTRGTGGEESAGAMSSIGTHESTAAMLAYSLGILSGLFFLLVERRSDFVRFHALQSVTTFGLLTAIEVPLAAVPVLSALIGFVAPASVVLWIYLMVKAQRHEWTVLPVVGDIMARMFPPRDG